MAKANKDIFIKRLSPKSVELVERGEDRIGK
jgi:hypothetical protein